MNRVPFFVRRHRSARVLFPLMVVLGVVLYIACSDDPAPYQPLGDDHHASQAVLAGKVRDLSRAPVGGAMVSMEALSNGVPATALLLKEQPELAGKIDMRASATSSDLRRVTLTDERGRFVFDDVPAGEYAIQVRADNHLGASANALVPRAALTIDTIIVDVNLTPTGTFSGVATLENAATHPDIVVFAEGTSYVAVTAPDGSYAMTDVPVGSYTIRATHAHYLDDSEPGTLTFAGENAALPAMLLKIDNNIAPVATITVPAQPMETGTPINLQGAGTDIDGSVVLYEWDFENDGIMDASSAMTGNTSNVYSVAGTYTVKLRVTDNLGAIGLDAETIVVTTPAAPYVFMSPAGNDVNAGTQANPVKTLARAYQVAQLDGKTTIRAALGTYLEVPTFLGGINLEGGYDMILWTPNAGYTTFNAGTLRAMANGITTATTISRVEITTSNQVSSANSIALVSSTCSSALVFDNCIFRASAAGPAGPNGAPGSPGANASNGVSGGNGSCDGSPPGPGGPGGASPIGCPGGNGGTGGVEINGDGAPGLVGACGGGAGGSGGGSGDPGGDGTNGLAGGSGTVGALGTTSLFPHGTVIAGQWVPSGGGNGGIGTHGRGGGGGGGGGSQSCTFCDDGAGNGGGGGGGGGAAGVGGGGGPGGYASIAVLLISSSPTFQNCAIYTSAGGAGRVGGAGGNGGSGGAGGVGGFNCTGEIGQGGNGGAGGIGGGGGGGAGGAGGASVGIMAASGSSPILTGVSYTLGPPGIGGAGGQAGNGGGFAPNGAAGVFANTLTI